jgi:hypothetical protein
MESMQGGSLPPDIPLPLSCEKLKMVHFVPLIAKIDKLDRIIVGLTW